MLMMIDMVPRSPGYVSVGSRRYQKLQTLAFKATTDLTDEMIQEDTEPLVSRPSYRTPTQILNRPEEKEETKINEIKRVNGEVRRRSQLPSPCMPVKKIHKTADDDQDLTNVLFEQN